MSADLLKNIAFLVYITSTICFILGLKKTTKVSTARAGNRLSAFAMLLAILGTLIELGIVDDYRWIVGGLVAGSLIGALMAKRVEMTKMPELVAIMHSMIGLAAVFIAVAAVAEPYAFGIVAKGLAIPAGNRLELFLGAAIGAITFSGSVIAFGKLSGFAWFLYSRPGW